MMVGSEGRFSQKGVAFRMAAISRFKHFLWRFFGGIVGLVWALNLATLALASSPGQAAPSTISDAYLLWLVVGGAGMFGGFLFGIRDKKLTLPHWHSRHTIDSGFVGDCLFGLAGGFLVFILLPGNFEFNIAKPEEIIKIVAVAVVGGYGGRALVEKVLAQQFYELESDVQELREQSKLSGTAIALLQQHFDDDLDTPPIQEADLKEAVKNASSSVKVLAFDMAHSFRKKHYEKRPDLIVRAIPVFEALIEDDQNDEFHRNHGDLGYTYKDKVHPEWPKAEAELTRAIEIRDRQQVEGFLLYELNRAMCLIQLGANLDAIKRDLENVLRYGPKNGEWVRQPHPRKAKILLTWLRENEPLLHSWLAEHDIQLATILEASTSV
jgi:hypothetical protein